MVNLNQWYEEKKNAGFCSASRLFHYIPIVSFFFSHLFVHSEQLARVSYISGTVTILDKE